MKFIPVALWGKCIPDRGKSQCKGLRAGVYLVCLENRKVASVAAESKGENGGYKIKKVTMWSYWN